MGSHPPITGQSHWAFRKPWSFSFSTLIQKRNCLAHTHTETKDPQHLFWEAERSSTAPLSTVVSPPCHGSLEQSLLCQAHLSKQGKTREHICKG